MEPFATTLLLRGPRNSVSTPLRLNWQCGDGMTHNTNSQSVSSARLFNERVGSAEAEGLHWDHYPHSLGKRRSKAG